MRTSFTKGSQSLEDAWKYMDSWPGRHKSDYPAKTVLELGRGSFSLDQTGLPPPL